MSGLQRYIALCSLVLTVLFVGLNSTAFGQAPGYQGKRLVVHYSPLVVSALRYPNSNQATSFTSMNLKHTFAFDWATSRTKTIGFTVKQYKTGIEFSGSPSSNSTIDTRINGRIYAWDIGFHAQFFSSGGIAPLGIFHQVELARSFYQVVATNESFLGATPGTQGYLFNDWVFNYTVGKQRLFFNRLTFRYGVQFGVAFLGSALQSSSGENSEKFLEIEAKRRLRTHHMINGYIGIGFLGI